MIEYRQNLVDTLKEKCKKTDGWCLNNHNCIISPNEIVADDFKNTLQTKIYNNILELKRYKRFLANYTENQFDRDCKWAETLYKTEQEPIKHSNAHKFQKKVICK